MFWQMVTFQRTSSWANPFHTDSRNNNHIGTYSSYSVWDLAYKSAPGSQHCSWKRRDHRRHRGPRMLGRSDGKKSNSHSYLTKCRCREWRPLAFVFSVSSEVPNLMSTDRHRQDIDHPASFELSLDLVSFRFGSFLTRERTCVSNWVEEGDLEPEVQFFWTFFVGSLEFLASMSNKAFWCEESDPERVSWPCGPPYNVVWERRLEDVDDYDGNA